MPQGEHAVASSFCAQPVLLWGIGVVGTQHGEPLSTSARHKSSYFPKSGTTVATTPSKAPWARFEPSLMGTLLAQDSLSPSLSLYASRRSGYHIVQRGR